MTTATVPAPADRTRVHSRDRVFYTGISLALLATMIAGFSRTYYLPMLRGEVARTISGGPVTGLFHLHGTLFTLWMLLLVVQTTLVASRRIRLHRALGVVGGGLAASMVVVGLGAAIRTAARGGAPTGVDPRAFLVVPLFDIALFAAFVSLAIVYRRRKEAHKRLMVLASVSIVTAAVARIGGVQLNPLVFFGLTALFIVAGVIHDVTSRGRVHPVYLWGGAAFVASVPLRLALSSTAAWLSFADWLTR